MKNIIYTIFITMMFLSCDNSEDMFIDSNKAPILSINSSNEEYQTDSLKLNEVYYSLNYKIEDEEELDIDIQIDSIYLYEIEDNTIILGAKKAGTSNIYIKTTDSWGSTDQITFKLICFENLSPVAILEIDTLTNDRAFKLDASSSYDRDADDGGGISLYRFYVNEKEIDKIYHSYINYYGCPINYLNYLSLCD